MAKKKLLIMSIILLIISTITASAQQEFSLEEKQVLEAILSGHTITIDHNIRGMLTINSDTSLGNKMFKKWTDYATKKGRTITFTHKRNSVDFDEYLDFGFKRRTVVPLSSDVGTPPFSQQFWSYDQNGYIYWGSHQQIMGRKSVINNTQELSTLVSKKLFTSYCILTFALANKGIYIPQILTSDITHHLEDSTYQKLFVEIAKKNNVEITFEEKVFTIKGKRLYVFDKVFQKYWNPVYLVIPDWGVNEEKTE